MRDPPGLNYFAERRRSVRPLCAGLGAALVGIAVMIYLLFELQRAPYRPPQDMSTLLGGDEIRAVRLFIAALGLAWLGCLATLVVIAWRRRPGKPGSGDVST